MTEDIFEAAEIAYKTASVRKTAFDPTLATFAVSLTGVMLAKWLGNRGKEQAQDVTARAEQALQERGISDMATLDKYAQENGKNRISAFLGLVGRDIALAAAITAGVSVNAMLRKVQQVEQNPQTISQQVQQPAQPATPQQQAPAQAEQAPAEQQLDTVNDPFYEKQQAEKAEKQHEKEQWQQLRETDKNDPNRSQGIV